MTTYIDHLDMNAAYDDWVGDYVVNCDIPTGVRIRVDKGRLTINGDIGSNADIAATGDVDTLDVGNDSMITGASVRTSNVGYGVTLTSLREDVVIEGDASVMVKVSSARDFTIMGDPESDIDVEYGRTNCSPDKVPNARLVKKVTSFTKLLGPASTPAKTFVEEVKSKTYPGGIVCTDHVYSIPRDLVESPTYGDFYETLAKLRDAGATIKMLSGGETAFLISDGGNLDVRSAVRSVIYYNTLPYESKSGGKGTGK